MAFKIVSPIEGYNGTTEFGPFVVEFVDGETVMDSMPDGLRAYMEGAGYEVVEEGKAHKHRSRTKEKSE